MQNLPCILNCNCKELFNQKESMKQHLFLSCPLMPFNCRTCKITFARQEIPAHDCKAGLILQNQLLEQKLLATKLKYKAIKQRLEEVCPTIHPMPTGYKDWSIDQIRTLLEQRKPKCKDGMQGVWKLWAAPPNDGLCFSRKAGNECLNKQQKFYIYCEKC